MKRRNEVMVGVSVILSILLVVFGTVWLQGLELGAEPRIIKARFEEVGLLVKGNRVKQRGVEIGRIESIELEPLGTGVIVTMSVDPDVRLPDEPVVVLAPESMFGAWMAQIFPRETYGQYKYAESPDRNVLPGFSLPDISRLTAVADQIASNMKELTDRFEIAFTDQTASNVAKAIQNIEAVSGELTSLIERQQMNADEVAANLQTTSQSLGEAAETARRAFAQLELAVGGGKLTNIVANVQRATSQADTLAAQLLETAKQLKSTAITADSALRAVGQIAGSIERGEGSLGKFVKDTALYFRMTETTREVQLLLRDFRANPQRYINLRIF